MGQITEDTLYQGRVTLFQPEKGFRASTDSLMLAAALPEKSGGAALEIGCGCGGALMTAAFRLSQMQVTGVDIDAVMTDLARQSVSSNNFKDRVSVETGNAAEWVRDKENRFDLVFANPPYFEPGRISAPGAEKAGAYLESLSLDGWIKAHRWGLKIVTLVRQPCDQLFRRTHFRHGFEGAESTYAPFCVKGPENRPGRAIDRWIHQNSWQSREVLLRANLFAFALHQRRPPFQRNRHIAAQRHRDLSDKIALQ